MYSYIHTHIHRHRHIHWNKNKTTTFIHTNGGLLLSDIYSQTNRQTNSKRRSVATPSSRRTSICVTSLTQSFGSLLSVREDVLPAALCHNSVDFYIVQCVLCCFVYFFFFPSSFPLLIHLHTVYRIENCCCCWSFYFFRCFNDFNKSFQVLNQVNHNQVLSKVNMLTHR